MTLKIARGCNVYIRVSFWFYGHCVLTPVFWVLWHRSILAVSRPHPPRNRLSDPNVIQVVTLTVRRGPPSPRRTNRAKILRPLEVLKKMPLTKSLAVVEGQVLGRVDGWRSWRRSELLLKRDQYNRRR